MNFEFSQAREWTAIGVGAVNEQAVAITSIDFSSDGFKVLSLPTHSKFARFLNGRMGNVAYVEWGGGGDTDRPGVTMGASLDQWETVWRIFRQSEVVTVGGGFDANFSTEGFEEAAADFSACLAQLDLIDGKK